MRRNTESRYRIKLIQEMHLNKAEQKLTDDYKSRRRVSYKYIYRKITAKSFPKRADNIRPHGWVVEFK